MMRGLPRRPGFPIVLLGICASLYFLTGSLTAQRDGGGKVSTAEEHKAWMDDAGDVQEDLREALAAKDGKKTSEAALKIEGLMGRTEAYWTAKRGAADIVALAQTSRVLSKQVAAAGDANKLDQAQEAFVELSANCNTCHELHPEKR